MKQLDLFPLPPVPRSQQEVDRLKLASILRQAAAPVLAGPLGLSPRQVKLLLRPLPRLTLPPAGRGGARRKTNR